MSEQARAEQRVAGRYVLEAVLGRGGMGTVWQAMDELLGRPVAIKAVEIPDAVPEAERAKARARVLREARAAARLNHPQAGPTSVGTPPRGSSPGCATTS